MFRKIEITSSCITRYYIKSMIQYDIENDRDKIL